MATENKRVNKGLLVVVIVFILLVSVVASFYAGRYYANLEYTKNNDIIDKVEEEKEIKISKEEVLELYNNIPSYNGANYYAQAYQNKKVTIDNLDNYFVLAFAFTKINFKDENVRIEPYFCSECEGEKEYMESLSKDELLAEGSYIFDAEILQKKALDVYGTKIKNDSFDVYGSSGVSYNEDENKYVFSTGGVSYEYAENVRKFIDYSVDKDYLYIEDNYVFIYAASTEEDVSLYNVEVYSGSDKSGLVNKEVYNIENLFNDNHQISQLIKNKYVNSMTRYKHTFKKNGEGKYYWLSSEPIK